MTKKRRSLLLVGIIVAFVAVSLVVLATMATGPGVTKANFDRVEIGMTLSEVEQILGGPGVPFQGFVNQPSTLVWSHEDGAMAFVEAKDQTVASKTWHPSRETLTDKLRRWLHLPK
jgi:hypothetical protein